MADVYDVGIVGGGVAGLSAAMYTGRLKMRTLVLTELRGGTLTLTNEIRNWPGIKNIDGMGLAKQLEEHALDYKDSVEIKDARVAEVRKKNGNFVLKTSSAEYEVKTVIFATGTEVRKLKVPGEEEFNGKGVHYCALCDGPFYKEKVLAVVGGSDSAAKEALLLTQWAKKVYIIYRKEKIRAEPINLERVEKSDKIEVINNTNVVEIKGEKDVQKVVFDKEYKGSKEFALDAMFIEIGRNPLTELAKQLDIELNEKGEVKVNRQAETNVPGFYAAGDVTDSRFKQAIVSSSEGVNAAYSAYIYLQGKK